MGISAISGSSGSAVYAGRDASYNRTYVHQASDPGVARPSPAQMKTILDTAAKTLGMSTTDLRSALGQGQTLAGLATSKGVSNDSLTRAMASAVNDQSGSASGGGNSSSSQAVPAMVQSVINHRGGQHHHAGGGMQAPDSTNSSSSTPATLLASVLNPDDPTVDMPNSSVMAAVVSTAMTAYL
jgi:hypothetical protein